jgi:hypothetical protein
MFCIGSTSFNPGILGVLTVFLNLSLKRFRVFVRFHIHIKYADPIFPRMSCMPQEKSLGMSTIFPLACHLRASTK